MRPTATGAQSSPTTTLSTQLPVSLRFSQIRVSDSKYLSTQFLPKVLMRWHRLLRNCTSTSVTSFNAQSSSTKDTPKTIASQFPISKSVTWFGSTREISGQDDPQKSLIVITSGRSRSSRRFCHMPFDSDCLCYTLSQGSSGPGIQAWSRSSGVRGRVGWGFSKQVAVLTRLLRLVFRDR